MDYGIIYASLLFDHFILIFLSSLLFIIYSLFFFVRIPHDLLLTEISIQCNNIRQQTIIDIYLYLKTRGIDTSTSNEVILYMSIIIKN